MLFSFQEMTRPLLSKTKRVYSADGQQDKNFPVGTVGGHCFAAPSQVNYIIKIILYLDSHSEKI